MDVDEIINAILEEEFACTCGDSFKCKELVVVLNIGFFERMHNLPNFIIEEEDPLIMHEHCWGELFNSVSDVPVAVEEGETSDPACVCSRCCRFIAYQVQCIRAAEAKITAPKKSPIYKENAAPISPVIKIDENNATFVCFDCAVAMNSNEELWDIFTGEDDNDDVDDDDDDDDKWP